MAAVQTSAVRKALTFSRALLKDVRAIPVAAVAGMTPRKRDLWCFSACEGQRFGDHARMLFEEIRQSYPDIDVVWSTRSPDVYRELSKRNLPVVRTTSPAGFLTTLRAGVCVYTHYSCDHHMLAAVGTCRVQLWHGIPLKRFKADNNLTQLHNQGWPNNFYAWLKNGRNRLFSWNEPKWDLLIFQSELDRLRTGSAFYGEYRRSAVLGSIRAEWLVRKRAAADSRAKSPSNAIRILYAPTHRRRGLGSVFDNVPVPSASRLSGLLDSYKARIEICMHPLQAHEPLPVGFRIPSVNVAGDDVCCDIYESLLDCDVVVTDYSSVYIDAIAIDIPVVCLAPDRDQYGNEDQGFYSSVEEFPGPIVDTWEEALAACNRVLADGGDAWRQQHAAAKSFYYGSDVEHDRGSMARVIEKIQRSV